MAKARMGWSTSRSYSASWMSFVSQTSSAQRAKEANYANEVLTDSIFLRQIRLFRISWVV